MEKGGPKKRNSREISGQKSKSLRRKELKKRKLEAFNAIVAINRKDKCLEDPESSVAQKQLNGEGATKRRRLNENLTYMLNFKQLPSYVPSTCDEKQFFCLPVDVKQLVNYVISEKPCHEPRWCKLPYLQKPSKVVVIVIQNMAVEDIKDNAELFTFLKANFDDAILMVSPLEYGSSMAEEFFATLPFKQEAKPTSGSGAVKFTCPNDDVPLPDQCSRMDLVLSPLQMSSEQIPMPFGKWRESKSHGGFSYSKSSYTPLTEKSPLIAVDCEMCQTTAHSSEIARVALTDESHTVIYDTLVKPPNEITDYRTQYSGVTKELLDPVTTTLEDVQRDLQSILPSDAILCGHSICNDLLALRLFHPYAIDSSVIFNLSGYAKKKASLRNLSRHFLQRSIQNNPEGHCSAEDAATTLQLVQLKLKNDLNYGNVIQNGVTVPPKFQPVLAVPVEMLPTRMRHLHTKKDEISEETEKKSETVKIEPELDSERNKAFFRHYAKCESCSSVLTVLESSKKKGVIISQDASCDKFSSGSVSVHQVSCRKACSKMFKSSLQDGFLVYCQMSSSKITSSKVQRLDRTLERMLSSLEKDSLVNIVFEGRTASDGKNLMGLLMSKWISGPLNSGHS